LCLPRFWVAIGAALVVALQLTVPPDTGIQPAWSITLGFVVSIACTCVMCVAAVAYALREIERAEQAMELEYERSESLLANILPASIASRLKNASSRIIADRYEDASVLFADIAGYTEQASDTTPAVLVEFLDRLYTDFDRLVDGHDPRGRAVPLRIGIGAGPVVAGVVGRRRFFYDVWGDAVNVASRMESTGVEGRIQVPDVVRPRLEDDFELEGRGEVVVKGKGVMRTWFLVGRRNAHNVESGPAMRVPES
jgi:adenylate cyclase